MDLIITDDGTDRYFLNQGNGGDGMANFISYTFPASTNGLGGNSVAADLNNDGWNDVLIADVDVDIPGCNRVSNILRNNGNPPNVTFTADSGNIPNSMLQGVHDIAVFDINGDGWLDIVLGRCSSSEIWIQHPYGVLFDFPQGLPSVVAPDEPFTIQAQLTPVGGTVAPDTATLHYAINYGPFTSVLMTDLGGNLYEADLPPAACLDGINFYFSAETVEKSVYSTDPPDAPANTYRADAATGVEITHVNHFEAGEDLSDWTIVSDPSLTAGEWEQADPNGTFFFNLVVAPEDDATPGPDNVMAFVTENGPPGGDVDANDVDGGPTYLTSPSFDLQGTNAVISYAHWFRVYFNSPNVLAVEVSNDGSNWVLVESIASTGGEWKIASFLVGDYVQPSENVQVRFSTSDLVGTFFTEAGIDDFQVEQLTCGPACPADLNGDGSVGILDLLALLAVWGTDPGGPPDFDGDGSVGILDLLALLANWGACP